MRAWTTRTLLVFGVCGLVGVSVDVFDGVALATNGPGWLHQLDLLVAVLYTALVLGVDARTR